LVNLFSPQTKKKSSGGGGAASGSSEPRTLPEVIFIYLFIYFNSYSLYWHKESCECTNQIIATLLNNSWDSLADYVHIFMFRVWNVVLFVCLHLRFIIIIGIITYF